MNSENNQPLPKEKNPPYQEIQERLAAAIDAVIEQQLATQDPVETLLTLERLQEEGFSHAEARGLIAQVVSLEVAELVAGTGVLDLERYITSLSELPQPFADPKTGLSLDLDLEP